jgi:hypothetical protein
MVWSPRNTACTCESHHVGFLGHNLSLRNSARQGRHADTWRPIIRRQCHWASCLFCLQAYSSGFVSQTKWKLPSTSGGFNLELKSSIELSDRRFPTTVHIPLRCTPPQSIINTTSRRDISTTMQAIDEAIAFLRSCDTLDVSEAA